MAIPDDLASWRRYLSTKVVTPRLINSEEFASLGAREREAYDAARIAFLAADVVLETPDLEAVLRLARILAAEARIPSTTMSKALAISGDPTMGKTTAALVVAREHEQRARASNPRLREGFQPTIYVITPPATTPKMLMIAFCSFLGLPYKRTETAQDLTTRVLHVLRELRTSLVVLDEVHNLQSNRTQGSEAASTLKLFAERLDAAFIYAGVDLPNSAAFSGPSGQQLAHRMALYRMQGYSLRSQAGRRDWLELVLTLQDLLMLNSQREQTLRSLAGYLYDRTGGSVGRLRTLLRRGAIVAIQDGSEQVNKRLLDLIPDQATGIAPLYSSRVPAVRQA